MTPARAAFDRVVCLHAAYHDFFTHPGVSAFDEIQQRLVDHCAADATYGRGGLLGRKQWIGSVEVGEFLMSAIGATCKSEYCRTGDEVLAKGRKLQHHFETQGTPVMIGGGELAFTLLGVHFNDQTGDPNFYESSEALDTAWKAAGMKSDAKYYSGGHCQTHSFEDIATCMDDGTGRLIGSSAAQVVEAA